MKSVYNSMADLADVRVTPAGFLTKLFVSKACPIPELLKPEPATWLVFHLVTKTCNGMPAPLNTANTVEGPEFTLCAPVFTTLAPTPSEVAGQLQALRVSAMQAYTTETFTHPR